MPNEVSRRDVVVVWRVTSRCTLACPFCAFSREVDLRRSSVPAHEVVRFGELLAHWAKETARTVHISFLGGEPFLWPPLQQVTQHLSSFANLSLSLTTNGLALDRWAQRKFVLDYLKEITISLDALGDTHSTLRGMPGLYEKLKNGIRLLSTARSQLCASLCIRINIVLMHQNVRLFENLCAEVQGWGVDEVTFNELGGRDRPEYYPAHRLTVEDVSWFCAELPRIREKISRLRIMGSERYLSRIYASAAGESIAVNDCRPGKTFLFIDELGRVSPCSFTCAEYGQPVAMFKAVHDLESLSGEFALNRGRLRARACNDCRATHVYSKFGVNCLTRSDTAVNLGT